MFISNTRCPNCRATFDIRTEDNGDYQAGECFNCRYDRSAELPSVELPVIQPEQDPEPEQKPVDQNQDQNQDNPQDALPPGVTSIGAGWYQLEDGSKVRKKELAQIYPDWSGE